MLKTKEMNNEILAKHTGQPLDRLRVDLERDYYMGPQEAIEYGVVDKIVERHTIINATTV
jgi:ATP-dependent Clp protease protease subunit